MIDRDFTTLSVPKTFAASTRSMARVTGMSQKVVLDRFMRFFSHLPQVVQVQILMGLPGVTVRMDQEWVSRSMTAPLPSVEIGARTMRKAVPNG